MMSKAEDRALEKYPKESRDIDGIIIDIGHPQYMRDLYIEGYHQAEKDNELTWEDMECIIKHYQDIMAEKSRVFVRVEDYKELLKRYKDYKERKEK